MNVRQESRTENSTYPKGGVSCYVNTFVRAESSVLRMKFCGKSPALQVAAKRYRICFRDTTYHYGHKRLFSWTALRMTF